MLIILSSLLFILMMFCLYYEVASVKDYYLPFFSLVAAYYFIFHGIIPFYIVSAEAYTGANVQHLPYSSYQITGKLENLNFELRDDAVLYTMAFIAFQFAGYFLASRFFHKPYKPSVSIEPSAAIRLISWTLLVGYFIIFALLQNYQIPSLPQLKGVCWYFSFSAITFLFIKRQLSLPEMVVFVIAAISKLTLDIFAGFVTPILFDTLIVLVAALIHKSYRLLLISSLVCVCLFGSYGYIKYFATTFIRGETLIIPIKPEISRHSLTISFNSMARRSSHLLLTSYVFDLTPSPIPFDERNPFKDALVNHIPRVFWPSKPKETLGHNFGKRYKILNETDTGTSWNVPWIVDFYISLGPISTLFSIFIIGGIFGICVSWLSSRPDKTFWFGVYSATLLPLFYQESNFSLMTGNVFSGLAFLLFAYHVAKAVLRPRASAHKNT